MLQVPHLKGGAIVHPALYVIKHQYVGFSIKDNNKLLPRGGHKTPNNTLTRTVRGRLRDEFPHDDLDSIETEHENGVRVGSCRLPNGDNMEVVPSVASHSTDLQVGPATSVWHSQRKAGIMGALTPRYCLSFPGRSPCQKSNFGMHAPSSNR